MAIGSVVLALLVGAAFVVLLLAISDLRASGRLVTNSRAANAAADRLEERVVDLESGARGFVITRQERFLEPWRAARVAFRTDGTALEELADLPEQRRRAREITRDIAAYITEYSIPLVNAARRNLPSAESIATTEEGKVRVDGLRRSFDRFRSFERALLLKRRGARRHQCHASHHSCVGGACGLGGAHLRVRWLPGPRDRAAAAPCLPLGRTTRCG